jgi:hypothetical protein
MAVDFGLFKGTKFSFDDAWDDEECISEVGLEKRLNKDGLRYRLDRTKKEADEVGVMYDLPGITVNLPIIGETYLGPPKRLLASGKLLVSLLPPTTKPANRRRSRPSKRPVLPSREFPTDLVPRSVASGLISTDTLVL